MILARPKSKAIGDAGQLMAVNVTKLGQQRCWSDNEGIVKLYVGHCRGQSGALPSSPPQRRFTALSIGARKISHNLGGKKKKKDTGGC